MERSNPCPSLNWLGILETTKPHAAPWLFQNDLAPFVWKLLGQFKCPTPNYRTEERELIMLIRKPHPPMTGYRILLSVSVLIFGLIKAILTYTGKSTAPTTIDWVFAVVVTLRYVVDLLSSIVDLIRVWSLYWLGLYESSSPEVLPILFETDHTQSIGNLLAPCGSSNASH
jgi:hypothetical protein